MCGIYGFADLNLLRASEPALDLLTNMGGVVIHRGPDDEGQHVENGVGLGMRRLSIIDLAGGHQPISNEDGTIWIVCNGEIYNFRELRVDLESKGHIFGCNSDVETMVHLYEQEGIEFVNRLRGMFAFALWDGPRARLVLGRDRLGEKPLYVRHGSDRVLFASEVKSILQAGDIPRRLDPTALRQYIALGYVPAPLTLFDGIRKVLPGHLLVIEKGEIQDREYWDVRFDQIEVLPEREWEARVRDKLIESVRMRLVSDVPLGAFLSGGIDSSSIVAAMARLSDRPVKTYSIGYDSTDKYYNELPYADIVARTFGTEHHEIIVKPEVSELLPRLVWHLDEPIADSAIITTYLVSQLARESVTVILSGVGGDELFGGYRRYLGDSLQRYYRWLPRPVRSKWLPGLLSRLPQDRHSAWKNNIRYATAFSTSAELNPIERYMSYVALLSPEIQSQLLQGREIQDMEHEDGAVYGAINQYFRKCPDADGVNQLMYVDIKTSLVDDLLTLTDKTSMAASVECRAPFLDHELVELTAKMPSDLKVRGLTTKYLLKKALGPWLPGEILHRKKRGFGAPVGAWLRDDLRFLTRELLAERQVRKRGFLNWPVVQEIISSHEQQRSDKTDSLLALICLELWCKIFLDGMDWKSVRATPAQFAKR